MADEGCADLLGIGEHCGVTECRQLDFLPFSCDCCSRTFCLDHRSYTAHACPSAGSKQFEVIVCPLCAKAIRLKPGQEPNSAFEAHSSSDCDPAHYNKVHNKPRCPVAGCKEKLSLTNTYRCKTCATKVCLKHRHEEDHACNTLKAQHMVRGAASGAATQKASGSWQPPPQANRPLATAKQTQSQAARKEGGQKQNQDPSNSLMGTAQRRQPPASSVPSSVGRQQQQQQRQQQQQQQQRQQQQQQQHSSQQVYSNPAARSNANPLVPQHLPEVCPQCQARFATVQRLVQHVEDFHPASPPNGVPGAMHSQQPPAGGWPGARSVPSQPAAADSQQDQFRCPRCSAVFFNPVRLVQHQETCGVGRQQAARGGKAEKGGCILS